MGKRKKRYAKITTKSKLVPVETPAEIRSQLPSKLIEAYIEVMRTDFEDIEIYDKFKEMAKEHLGDKDDRDSEVGLIVRLTRATLDLKIEEKCGEHSNYRGMRKPRSGCKRCWAIYNEKTKAKKKTTKKAKEKAKEAS